jgi:hypothetical protein
MTFKPKEIKMNDQSTTPSEAIKETKLHTDFITNNKTDPQLNAMLKAHDVNLKMSATMAYVFANTPERNLITEDMRAVPYTVSPVILQYFKDTKLPNLFKKFGIFTIILYSKRSDKSVATGGSYNYLAKMKNGSSVFINIPMKNTNGVRINEAKAAAMTLLELINKLTKVNIRVQPLSEVDETLQDRITAFKKNRLANDAEKAEALTVDLKSIEKFTSTDALFPVIEKVIDFPDTTKDNFGDLLLKKLEDNSGIH